MTTPHLPLGQSGRAAHQLSGEAHFVDISVRDTPLFLAVGPVECIRADPKGALAPKRVRPKRVTELSHDAPLVLSDRREGLDHRDRSDTPGPTKNPLHRKADAEGSSRLRL